MDVVAADLGDTEFSARIVTYLSHVHPPSFYEGRFLSTLRRRATALQLPLLLAVVEMLVEWMTVIPIERRH